MAQDTETDGETGQAKAIPNFFEPWTLIHGLSEEEASKIGGTEDRIFCGIDGPGGGGEPVDVLDAPERRVLRRIVSCVNAFHGLDPADARVIAALSALRASETAGRERPEVLSKLREDVKAIAIKTGGTAKFRPTVYLDGFEAFRSAALSLLDSAAAEGTKAEPVVMGTSPGWTWFMAELRRQREDYRKWAKKAADDHRHDTEIQCIDRGVVYEEIIGMAERAAAEAGSASNELIDTAIDLVGTLDSIIAKWMKQPASPEQVVAVRDRLRSAAGPYVRMRNSFIVRPAPVAEAGSGTTGETTLAQILNAARNAKDARKRCDEGFESGIGLRAENALESKAHAAEADFERIVSAALAASPKGAS